MKLLLGLTEGHLTERVVNLLCRDLAKLAVFWKIEKFGKEITVFRVLK